MEIKLNGRELLWDFELAETNSGIIMKNHQPVRKNIALRCGESWEGEHCGYGSLIKDGDVYKLYYRGAGYNDGPFQFQNGSHGVVCLAVSQDGKKFTKPNLGLYEWNGSGENNIVMMRDDVMDNFSVYLDENPHCDKSERYKALSHRKDENKRDVLCYYVSEDGLSFRFVRNVDVPGKFDSLNTLMWNKETGRYRIYLRNFHEPDGSDTVTVDIKTSIRDIRYSESEDFVHWTVPQQIQFTDERQPEIQYYTNGITKYNRGNFYYGMPVRYIDRADESVNFQFLPDMRGNRQALIDYSGRGGTAMTDATLFVSRDGTLFERSKEAFLTPGLENGENWVYGDCYLARGLFETESDLEGEPPELSFFCGWGYRSRCVDFVRYTMRLDGLRSWYADWDGGQILTRPFTFEGDKLSINFATSALGSLRIRICDSNGTPIEGYDSKNLFGNSVDRPVLFEQPLSCLKGVPVRLHIQMQECDFYSFCFYEKDATHGAIT